MKAWQLLLALVLLSTGHVQGQSMECAMAMGSCLTAFGTATLSNLLDPLSCTPFNTLQSCLQTLVDNSTCSQDDLDMNSGVTSAMSTYSRCMKSGAALPKASLLGLLVASIIGYLLKA